jgi:hypothetical protein
MFILDPETQSQIFPCQILNPGSRAKKAPDFRSEFTTKNLSILNPNNSYDPGCLLQILDSESRIRIFSIPDPCPPTRVRVKKAQDPGSRSAKLLVLAKRLISCAFGE